MREENVESRSDQHYRIENNICRVNTQIRLEQHQLVVTQVNKTALSAFDDKRFLLDCSVKSFAYGHHSLRQSSNTVFNLMHKGVIGYVIPFFFPDFSESTRPDLVSSSSAEDDDELDDDDDGASSPVVLQSDDASSVLSMASSILSMYITFKSLNFCQLEHRVVCFLFLSGPIDPGSSYRPYDDDADEHSQF